MSITVIHLNDATGHLYMDRHLGYIIFPEALEKLRNAGIVSRVEDAERENIICGLNGALYENDVVLAGKRLVEEEYYLSLDKEDRKRFFDDSRNLFKDRTKSSWKINRRGAEENEEVCLEDILLLIGDSASQILAPVQFGEYRKNGFDSFSVWVGCVGAFIESERRNKLKDKRDYEWKSALPNGRIIENSIGGSMHGDLSIKQTELTPYPTVDPFGNSVPYRPITRKDRKTMSPYHSTETSLLIAVLDYIDQREVPSEIARDKAQKIIAEIRSGTSRRGNWAESFSGADDHMSLYFVGYGRPLAEFTPEGNLTHSSGHGLTVEGGRGAYIACITPEGNLGFYYRSATTKDKPEIKVEFQASEIDHVIKGLVHQSTNGLGRTSPGTLANALAYRFSDNFTKEKH